MSQKKQNNWYIAKLVEYVLIKDKETKEIINSGSILNYHNKVLIKAKDAGGAYKKALKLGRHGNYNGENTDGNTLCWNFAGILSLVKVGGGLGDGSILTTEESYMMSEENILNSIRSKGRMGVFVWEARMKKLHSRKELINAIGKPGKDKWYIAVILNYIMPEKPSSCGKRVNYLKSEMLLKAKSSGEAYIKAKKQGRLLKGSLTKEKKGKWKFAGVDELTVIHDKMEDGSELAYSRGYAKSENNIKRDIPEKKELDVFKGKL